MTGPSYTDSANFSTTDTTLTTVGSVNAAATLAGTGTLTATGTRSVAANFGMTGVLATPPSLVKITGAPAALGGDTTLLAAPIVKLTGATSFAGGGALTATGSKILFRDFTTYDGANLVSDSFQFTPPATLHDNDYGFLMVAWAAGSSGEPITVDAPGWDQTDPPMLINGLCTVVLSRRYVLATDAGLPVTVTLGAARAVTAAAGWWSGVAAVDNVGGAGSRGGASQAVTTAPGTVARATAGETVGLFYAELSSAIGTSATLSEGNVRTMIEGSGSAQASVLIGDLAMLGFGVSDDVIATYNTPSPNGIGLQISLLPVGTISIGDQAFFFTSNATLSASGSDTTKIASFSATGVLAATGIVVGTATFAMTGVLRADRVFLGTAALAASGQLATAGAPAIAVSPNFSSVGTLSAAGEPSFATNAALAGTGTVATPGTPLTVGIASLGTVASLSAAVHPVFVQTADYAGEGTLVAPGTPRLVTAASLSGAGLLASDVSVSFTDTAQFSATGTLSAVTIPRITRPVALSGAGALTALGIPDFTPISVVPFSMLGLLTATGFRPQLAPAEITNQPYYIRQTQDWAIAQERQRHQQAIYQVGEPALFLMMWKVEDFEAGLVSPCPRCRSTDDSVDARISAVYQQPQTARCPFCFGTTFEGGVRAKILRPAIFTDADEDERKAARGVTHGENAMVESTNDFRTRTGDYVFRRDGSRWQLGHPQRVMLRTGYEHPSQASDSLGYARIPAAREDASSVAFEIPPSREELGAILVEPLHYPVPTN